MIFYYNLLALHPPKMSLKNMMATMWMTMSCRRATQGTHVVQRNTHMRSPLPLAFLLVSLGGFSTKWSVAHAMSTTTTADTTDTTTTRRILSSFNPATGELLGELPMATPEDIVQAVSKAHVAQKQWAKKRLSERVSLVTQAYQSLVQSNDSGSFQMGMAQLLSMEMGKDLQRATGEVVVCIESGPFIAQEVAEALQPISLTEGATQHFVPLGVVGVISPWNYPLEMANNLILPALIAGNTVILKPSEQTPLVANEFFGRIRQALPESVLTVIHGDGQVGQWLVDNKQIQMIAFTGSLATGRDIMKRSANTIKRLVMELGGNDPMIVLHDADLDLAARLAVEIGFENSGQMCTSIERIYVDASIASEFESKVTQYARDHYENKVGPWNQPNVEIGPIINTKQHAKIVEHIVDAEQKGGRFLVGSSQQQVPYITPTIISGMTQEMKLEQEETFGPVIGISKFTNVQEAIDRANDSVFGLGAIVVGYQGAHDVAHALEAGMVGINQGQGGFGPWVGAKQSGFGYHGTQDGHRQFAQIKIIAKAEPDDDDFEEEEEEDA